MSEDLLGPVVVALRPVVVLVPVAGAAHLRRSRVRHAASARPGPAWAVPRLTFLPPRRRLRSFWALGSRGAGAGGPRAKHARRDPRRRTARAGAHVARLPRRLPARA